MRTKINSAKILLVEDHRDLAETLIQSLETEGYMIDYVSNGQQGLQLATEQVFDTIILDVMLPGKNGFEVCEKLRNELGIDTPILMLTARDQLEDKLNGFASGADDYLVKPFQMAELVARIESLIKRRRGQIGVQHWMVKDLSINIKTMIVKRSGRELTLTPILFNILKILTRESPAIVTREAIENELWGEEMPDSDALRSHIYTLRKIVDKPFSEQLIETVKGAGFRIRS